MKRRLNSKGIAKVVSLLEGKYDIKGNVMQGEICTEDHKTLLDMDIVAEQIDEGYHLLHEQDDQLLDNQEEITQPEKPIDPVDGEDKKLTPSEIRSLITQLIPHLNNYYPTKDEVNEVLNDLKAQMIDPQEWIEMFKGLGKKIKKQSRTDDEVG